MLRSDLCDYSDVYIAVKGKITVRADERDRDEMNRQVILKNNAPFISCISKINGALVESADGNPVNNPNYDRNKRGKEAQKKLKLLCY